jgi:type I restriction-modification system DNA methylase subunit
MEFNKAYNRNELVKFLRTNFLPEDFIQEETPLANPKQFQYTQQVTRLGECNSLELVVFEVLHSSVSDARVGLTKEAFRMLADEFCERALVFFVPQDDNSNYRFSLIEITLEQKEGTAKVQRTFSNPHRYSYYLGEGISYHTPNKYLNEAGRVVSIEDLRSRFSVEVLTKAFYQELSDWYAWAVKIVRFPNELKTEADNEKYNSEAMIRLITRLIFVWFIKQRKLVPDEFFDEKYISDYLLKSFTPNAKVTLFGKADNSYYYKGILQNLFFAMLNSPITPEGKDTVSERRFRKDGTDYDNNKLMRHEDLFKNPDLFVELANKYVPFLNGGLFDCLDDKDNGMYVDAFTDREVISKQLIVPDYLFFGEDVGRNIDLSEWYGDAKKKKVSARGIIDILKRYNFTVEENTPFDQEVSLDPELLGKVFENLLASYNPETQTTARKQTGSFYTPREIVQYMVDESLVAHLKRSVGDEMEPVLRQLVQYNDIEPELTANQKKTIMQSLYNCKVLDPACGSGAFPMGMLQQMVHVLNRIDPNNALWKEIMVENAISKTSEAYRNATVEERAEMVADIERSFNESINRPDYARKLYLIENCIYGVDIQPIAIQISKLRFFISLVVDQKTNNNPVDNFGIRPLPNLEAKFVAANTLIGLETKDANLFDSEAIKQKEKELKEAKHRIFGAKTVKTKRKYKERVATLRTEIAEMLKESGSIGNQEAQQLASWDMFDQHTSSPFFDPEWMFGVGDGFDVVIGNPPYGATIKEKKEYFSKKYYCTEGKFEIYKYFFERATTLTSQNGMIVYITPDTWKTLGYFKKMRKMLFEKCTIVSLTVSLYDIFSCATVDTTVTALKFNPATTYTYQLVSSDLISRKQLDYNINDDFILCLDEKNPILIKIEENASQLSLYAEIWQGLIAYAGKNQPRIWTSNIKETNTHRKLLYGKDISKYSICWSGEYLNYGEWLHRPRPSYIFDKEKILVQRIRNPKLKDRLVCALDNDQYINGTGLSNIILYDKFANSISLKFILGLINSPLINYWFSNYFVDVNIKPEQIRKIPIRIVSLSNQQPIIALVEKILAAKKADPQADTGAWEAEIDFLVYKLYGLSYDEVLVVDPGTSITREEYEKA